jgi:DNA transformation protein and related proteins
MNEKLTDMPNIGKELSKLLKNAGINTPGELISVGSKEAFIRIKTIDEGACLSKLYALEGAVQGFRWHQLDAVTKKELNELFTMIEKTNQQSNT